MKTGKQHAVSSWLSHSNWSNDSDMH